MPAKIRGFECSFYNGKFHDFLLFFAGKPFDLYIRKCMKIDDRNMLLPKSSYNFYISSYDLCELAKESIWELVLHIYPLGSNNHIIDTYSDYANSECICCLIFYDCGLLDIYVKDSNLYKQLHNLVVSLGADDIEIITDVSDKRTHLY